MILPLKKRDYFAWLSNGGHHWKSGLKKSELPKGRISDLDTEIATVFSLLSGIQMVPSSPVGESLD